MPWDSSQLPDLGSSADEEAVIDAIKRKRIGGNFGPFDVDLNHKRARIEARYRDALVRALLEYDGEYEVTAGKPLFGGELEFKAQGGDGNPAAYGLQYRRNF